VHNTYGPTEATVSCTILNIKNKSNYNTYLSGISIGSAIPGMKVFLINNDKVDCNEGEIVLSGPQLAKGYWKDPDCSSNSFKVINVKGKMTRVYFTGDWGVVKKGDIFFSSRIDSQVKINGYRVELGEVEAALELCGVTSCCLMVDHELHAYIEPGLVKFDEHYVRASLGEYIESYAMPMYFHILDSLPRNENDKIDRKYLIKNRGGL
jgi:D-alanine--poly(phosphoribitol) ligase subunit 1